MWGFSFTLSKSFLFKFSLFYNWHSLSIWVSLNKLLDLSVEVDTIYTSSPACCRPQNTYSSWLLMIINLASFCRVPCRKRASQVALVVRNSPANAGDIRDEGSTPGLGRSPERGHGNPLQYSYLENLMDRGAWQAIIHGVERVGHDLATKLPPGM